MTKIRLLAVGDESLTKKCYFPNRNLGMGLIIHERSIARDETEG